jgi:D-alanyl-D-alanine carboxypeptidase (penicillin-binding protein 5/6)
LVPSSNHEREANWRVDRIINRIVARSAAGLCILVLLLLPVKTSAQEVPELEINSRAYIVLDADTGEIYAQRNAHDQRAIGSLTKIFSTIEAIERASLTTEVTTSEWDYVPEDASVMGFTAGDTFTLEELLYGMMLPSGNDAAHAVARSVGRTSDDMSDTDAFRQFVDWMNLRVQAMGLVDTHLKNPDGWGVPDHHSSAYDLATFTRYALQYPEFEKLISTKTYETDNGYNLTNNNRLLGESPSIVGGKTGYDWDAGWCLVEVARRGDTTMISVTLDGVHDDGDWYDDNVVLLDYAFDQKEKREERGEAFEGDVAAYVDPSAALVAKSFAAAGSTTGQGTVTKAQGTPESTALPDSLFDSASPTVVAPVQSNSVSNSGGSDSSGFRLLAVAAVAVLVVGVRFADAWRRDPAGNPWTLKPKQALVSNEVLADVGDTQQMDPVMENGGEN